MFDQQFDFRFIRNFCSFSSDFNGILKSGNLKNAIIVNAILVAIRGL